MEDKTPEEKMKDEHEKRVGVGLVESAGQVSATARSDPLDSEDPELPPGAQEEKEQPPSTVGQS